MACQKVRIALARALYHAGKHPEGCVVLLDNPLAALDVHTAREVFQVCRRHLARCSCQQTASLSAAIGMWRLGVNARVPRAYTACLLLSAVAMLASGRGLEASRPLPNAAPACLVARER